MGKRPRRSYTAEYKRQAIELANRNGYTKVSKQLGVPMTTLHSWSPPSKSSEPIESALSPEEEIRKLRAEVEEQKKVIHILKAAAAFFSKDHLP
jgi:transposase